MSHARPRSYPTPLFIRRNRERTYPWIFNRLDIDRCGPCEACAREAKYQVLYEPNKETLNLSSVFLCSAHERLTRFGKWDQVFRDMDRKIGGGK